MRTTNLRASAVGAALVVILGGFPAAAFAVAAPPSNDTVAGATPVTTVPSTVTEDTTGATTDADDTNANSQCGAPATNASVWFTYTDHNGTGIVADMSKSDYEGGIIITDGPPNSDGSNIVACGPSVAATTGDKPDATYYIVAFSDTATNGGNLSIHFSKPQTPGTRLHINRYGRALRDGSAILYGRYSCTRADGYSSAIQGTLTQRWRRLKIHGDFFKYPLRCNGVVHRFRTHVTSGNGYFARGKAASVSVIFACNVAECSGAVVKRRVILRRHR